MDDAHESRISNDRENDREIVEYYFDLLLGEADEFIEFIRARYAGAVVSLNQETDPKKREPLQKNVEQGMAYLETTTLQRDALDVGMINIAKSDPEVDELFGAVPNGIKYDYLLNRYQAERLEGIDAEREEVAKALQVAQDAAARHEEIWSENVGRDWYDKQQELSDNIYEASRNCQTMKEYIAAGLNLLDAHQFAADEVERLHPVIAGDHDREQRAALEKLMADDPGQAYLKLVADYAKKYAVEVGNDLSGIRNMLHLFSLSMDVHLKNKSAIESRNDEKALVRWRSEHLGLMAGINDAEANIEELQKLRVEVADGSSEKAIEWAKVQVAKHYPRFDALAQSLPTSNERYRDRTEDRAEKHDIKTSYDRGHNR